MRYVQWSQTFVDTGFREYGLRIVLVQVCAHVRNHNSTSRTPVSTTVWDHWAYRTWILVYSASRIRFFYRFMDCCPFTAPFLLTKYTIAALFLPCKMSRKKQKKSSKWAADGKNEIYSLSRQRICYNMQKTLNLSQRTVNPKLCFGSGRAWMRIWLTKNRQFLGPHTKIAVTHSCGALWRATGSHVDWFSNANLFPRKITTGGGFSVDRRKVTCHYRFCDHRKMTFRCPVRVQKLFQIHLSVSDLINIIAKKLFCPHSAILKKFRVHWKLNVFENGDFCLISVRWDWRQKNTKLKTARHPCLWLCVRHTAVNKYAHCEARCSFCFTCLVSHGIGGAKSAHTPILVAISPVIINLIERRMHGANKFFIRVPGVKSNRYRS